MTGVAGGVSDGGCGPSRGASSAIEGYRGRRARRDATAVATAEGRSKPRQLGSGESYLLTSVSSADIFRPPRGSSAPDVVTVVAVLCLGRSSAVPARGAQGKIFFDRVTPDRADRGPKIGSLSFKPRDRYGTDARSRSIATSDRASGRRGAPDPAVAVSSPAGTRRAAQRADGGVGERHTSLNVRAEIEVSARVR
jgi:hypothetical protein